MHYIYTTWLEVKPIKKYLISLLIFHFSIQRLVSIKLLSILYLKHSIDVKIFTQNLQTQVHWKLQVIIKLSLSNIASLEMYKKQ